MNDLSCTILWTHMNLDFQPIKIFRQIMSLCLDTPCSLALDYIVSQSQKPQSEQSVL